MKIQATWRGCAVASAWAAGLGALVFTALLGPNVLVLLGWTALTFLLLTPFLRSFCICLDEHRLVLRAGHMFFFKQHIPLRFITGCTVLRTPLGRLTHTGVVVLSFSGGVCVVCGLSLHDAALLSRRLALGGPKGMGGTK